MPSTPLITCQHVEKAFSSATHAVSVLRDISLTVTDGEFLVITGPSGCGKSTLLHVLIGLEAPTSGTVTFLHQDLYAPNFTDDERTKLRKRSVGMVYQQPNWIKALTVLENVMFPLRITGEHDSAARSKAQAVLKMVGMLEWQDYTPTELSSGQQQKVALARAVITEPQLIVADEPTGNLDFQSGQELMQLLQSLNTHGRTIIMVTHDLEYLSYATRSLTMLDGRMTTTPSTVAHKRKAAPPAYQEVSI